MSGEDSGYVPPDHKTTAEFGVAGKPAASEEPPRPPSRSQSPTVEEVVGDYFDGDATTHDVPQLDGVGFQDLPSDDPEDDLETTYQEVPGDEPEDDFDATVRDAPPAVPFQKPPPPAVQD
ncbi:hypothetical protein GWI34_13250, partial [Actinomadura sp. DSM 109109]|nr:hypothetical protein [Actinomadura lepetitiana]